MGKDLVVRFLYEVAITTDEPILLRGPPAIDPESPRARPHRKVKGVLTVRDTWPWRAADEILSETSPLTEEDCVREPAMIQHIDQLFEEMKEAAEDVRSDRNTDAYQEIMELQMELRGYSVALKRACPQR